MMMTDELSARAIHERHMRESLEYRREYERTCFANDVAVRVVRYRAEHGLTQTALARLLGMHQSAIARLETGEHEPSLTTLSRLSQVLGEDFSIDITPDRMALRSAAGLSSARLERPEGTNHSSTRPLPTLAADHYAERTVVLLAG
jgi:transcriptional regulator with XRE-family HTH domain